MKYYTRIKVGYRAGMFGCIAEYFTFITINGKRQEVFGVYGLYGTEERIGSLLRSMGYEEFYTPSFYGRMTTKDVSKWHMDERKAIEYIKNGFEKSDHDKMLEQKRLDKILSSEE